MGVREIYRSLEQWQMGVKDLRRRMILAATPRERERWYAILLLAQGLTAAAAALERDPHTLSGVGLRRGRACGPDIRADRWFPPALDQTQREELKGVVEQPPAAAGIQLANWYWKVVRQFVSERFGISLCHSSWLNCLGFALKRPKKRLVKADEAKREAFVVEYATLYEEARRTGAKIFFAGEAHFRAAVPGRALYTSRCLSIGRWSSVVGGLDCRRHGEGYSPNPLSLEGEGGSFKITGVPLTKPPETERCQRRPGQLNVIWDNAPTHRGGAVREYLGTPGLGLRLMKLPGYSPDFNADEAIWAWAREEATGKPVPGDQGQGAGEGQQLPR